jgi:hypothetical protein
MEERAPEWYGEAAQSIAPVSLVMAFFTLVYTLWFGFAWGIPGSILFSLSVMFAAYLTVKSIRNIRHARLFEKKPSAGGTRIEKVLGIINGVSYGFLWIAVIVLFFLDLSVYIMPVVTLIIGLHFLPQAKVMNRKLDYFVAPIPIFTALLAIYFALSSTMSMTQVYALASVGGAIATVIYGLYMLRAYKKMAVENGVEYDG